MSIKIERVAVDYSVSSRYPTFADYKGCLFAMLIGSIVGIFVGVMPGAGASIAVGSGTMKLADGRNIRKALKRCT